MPIKPDTRNYGKDHPRYRPSPPPARAGENNPYSKRDEVDPPRDWDEKDFNRQPDQLPGWHPWLVDDHQSDA